MKIQLNSINQNPHQIREISTDEDLIELAESIKENGLLQPIKVRPSSKGYELIYGHRRVSAMRMLGWTECEAIIENVSDEESLIQSIAENIQRQDLDILDEARSYKTLIDFGYSIKQVAQLVNKPHGRISNRLSILRLPIEVQELVKSRKGLHTTTSELGGISPDSASRIASAVNEPAEAIQLAKKTIDEQLDSRDIREITALLKETPNDIDRSNIINQPWESSGNDKGFIQSAIHKSNHGFQPEALGDVFHRKIIWNLIKVGGDNFDHFTISYGSRTISQLIEILEMTKVDTLVDIRYFPVSRYKPEFSKENLRMSLINNGIDYLHIPSLGIPSDIRESFSKEDLFNWYDKNVDIGQELSSSKVSLKGIRGAFMCVEVDPQSCHRHRISNYLELNGFRILDL